MTDREQVLAWAAALVAENNYVVLDTETTDLYGEIVQWAVVAPDGELLGSGYVKPTVPISEEAQAIHGITEEMVDGAPAFDVAWPKIWDLLKGKSVVIYNAYFDVQRLLTSARPYKLRLPPLNTRCAMKQYAAFHGEWSDYRGDYKWQSLVTACEALGIAQGQRHDAVSDAQACAAVVQALAYLEARTEPLPEEARGDIVDDAASMLTTTKQHGPSGVELFDLEQGSVEL